MPHELSGVVASNIKPIRVRRRRAQVWHRPVSRRCNLRQVQIRARRTAQRTNRVGLICEMRSRRVRAADKIINAARRNASKNVTHYF